MKNTLLREEDITSQEDLVSKMLIDPPENGDEQPEENSGS